MNVLLAGPTGFIGRRLKRRLLGEPGIKLRLFLKDAKKLEDDAKSRAEIVEGDVLDDSALKAACNGIDTAYYMIHWRGERKKTDAMNKRCAQAFVEACCTAGVKRIIFLGHLNERDHATKHIQSSINVGAILSSKPEMVQILWFRAGIILGSGSAIFEIMRDVIEKLPVVLIPRWARRSFFAIGIDDVLVLPDALLDGVDHFLRISQATTFLGFDDTAGGVGGDGLVDQRCIHCRGTDEVDAHTGSANLIL